jgi:hypothetical protein
MAMLMFKMETHQHASQEEGTRGGVAELEGSIFAGHQLTSVCIHQESHNLAFISDDLSRV